MSKKTTKLKTLEELLEEALVPEEEKPYEVPDNWVWVKFGSVLSISSGTPLTKKQMDSNGDIPVYGGNGITGYHSKSNVNKSTIVIGRVGYYCGSVHETLSNAWITDNAFIVKYNERVYNKSFLYWYLLFNDLKRYSNSSAQPVISGRTLNPSPLVLPPINEQKIIADKVEFHFNKIDKAKKLIEEAKESFEIRRAAILDRAFRGKLTEGWRKDTPEIKISKYFVQKVKQEYLSMSGNKNKYKEISEKEIPYKIPENWTWFRAIDVCDVRDGTHDSPKYKEQGYPLITSKNLKKGTLDFTNINYIDLEDHINICKRSKVDTGDILFAMIGTIGNPVLVRDIKHEFSIKNVALFKPLKSIDAEFLAYYLESLNYLETLKDKTKGSTQKFIGLGMLRESLIPVPPIEEQVVIKNILNKLFSSEDLNQENIYTIDFEQIKQSILSKAFRGELGMYDPTEESVIELLKEVLKEQQN